MINIFKNTLAMSMANVLSVVVNIVCMPIIISRLGATGYGEYIFAFIQSQLVLLILNYSFDTYLVRECADKNDFFLAKMITKIYYTRLILYAFASISIIFFLIYTNKVSANVAVLSSLSVFPLCFNLLWYYQVKERMEVVAMSNVIGKLAFLVLIAIPFDNVEYVFVCWFVSNSIISLVYYLNINGRLSWPKINFIEILLMIKNASSIFSFQFVVGVIPALASNLVLKHGGISYMIYYDVFNKISSMLNLFTSSFMQSVYPIMAKKNNSNKVIVVFMSKIAIAIVALFISLISFTFIIRGWLDEALSYILGTELVSIDVVVFLSLIFSLCVSLNSLLSRYLVLRKKMALINAATVVCMLTVVFLPRLYLLSQGEHVVAIIIFAQFLMLFVMMLGVLKESKFFG
ncbi:MULTISPECIES: oligosaccharide flippase family protein [unclassified Vibrio]|uniref:oligosaccharide flippase family protein n=1 Tax=unclassified Vibrio TaxID=2614977 RepID=UPI00354CFA27